ncbi:jg13782 [Pararge aegeria aegeria]|uniref:Hyaluronidase n=2 Tax=Pararge aegeria TaxID=116150 RepID=A0A8S4S5X7_9NEOP|nr:jg13782 [Pararge aegeria aegeria]
MAVSAVHCGFVSENYVIDMPDIDAPKADTTPFQIYWNVPTKQCKSKNIPFDDLLRKFKISYNKNDRFEGETITIIYNVGLIPAVLRRDGGKFSVRNGGLPQEGNLELHLAALRETIIRLIPDPDFNGVGVLDMEDWRPIFRQQWGNLAPISDFSLSIEKRKYWWWPASWQKMEATKRFEDAARVFMEKTLSTAKQMRPKAVWGYYGFPYCFNMEGKNIVEHCSKDIKAENDRTYWLWAESTALYPSVYTKSSNSTSEIEKLVRGRLTEANRLKKAGDLVIPYFGITYRNGGFTKEKDVIAVLEILQKKNASGLIVWGASANVDTVDKCKQLYNYVNSKFGPIAKKYIQRINKLRENKIQTLSINIDDSNDSLNNSTNVITTTHTTTLKSSEDNNVHENIPATQISKNISHSNELELPLNKYFYETDDSKIDSQGIKESGIWNISENKLTDVLNNKNDNLITLFETTNNNGSYNDNQLKLSTSNLTKFVNLLNTNFTQNNVDKEQHFNKYYYENNASGVELNNTNESDIWSIVKYVTNFENGSITETVIEQLNENSRIMVQNHTDRNLNSSTTTNATSNNDSKECKNKSETFSITIECTTSSSNVTKNNTQTYPLNDLIKSNQNTNPANISVIDNYTEITPDIKKNIEQGEQLNNSFYKTDNNNEELKNSSESEIWNIVHYEISSENEIIVESIQSMQNSSINSNHTEIALEDVDSTSVLEFTSSTPNTSKPNSQNFKQASRENDVSDYFITVGSDSTSLINASISDVETDINLKNSSSLEINILPPNSYSKNISQNVKEEEQLLNNTSYGVSGFLTTLIEDNTNSMNASLNDTKTKTSLENKEQFSKNISYPNIETTTIGVKNVSDYLVILAEDFTNPINTSMTSNVYEIINNFPEDLAQNVEQEKQLLNYTSYTNIEENHVPGLLTPLIVDFNNNMNASSINDNGTKINLENKDPFTKNKTFAYIETTTYGVKNVSNDSIVLLKNCPNLSNTSINGNGTKLDLGKEKQFTKNITYSNIETTTSGVINVTDYIIILAENFTNPTNSSMTSNLDVIINNHSKDFSQNVKQEEQRINHTSFQNTEAKGNGKSDVSGFLTTLTVNFPNSVNATKNDNNIKINLETTEQFTKNTTYPNIENTKYVVNNVSDYSMISAEDLTSRMKTYPNIEKTTNEVNNITDYSMILAGNFSSPMNSSMTDNANEIINNFPKDSSQNVNREEQLESNSSFFNVKEKANRKNDVSDYLITIADLNNIVKTTTNAKYIETNRAKFSDNNDVSDYLITSKEDFTYFVNTPLTGNAGETNLENEESIKNTTVDNFEASEENDVSGY